MRFSTKIGRDALFGKTEIPFKGEQSLIFLNCLEYKVQSWYSYTLKENVRTFQNISNK